MSDVVKKANLGVTQHGLRACKLARINTKQGAIIVERLRTNSARSRISWWKLLQIRRHEHRNMQLSALIVNIETDVQAE